MQNHLSKLKQLADVAKTWRLGDLFTQNPKRAEQFTFTAEPLSLDLSKNFLQQDTLEYLIQLADELDIPNKISALFNKETVNLTENRQAMHWLLRAPADITTSPESDEVNKTLERMGQFVDAIHTGAWQSEQGNPIKDIVNLGVGGSDLGPKMCVHALKPFATGRTKVHFVSNIDGLDISNCLQHLDPQSTLFIITSKTFTTLETLNNAHAARAWLNSAGVTNFSKHFVAVSSAVDKAKAFGVAPQNIFPIWDWVGGRYSLWSAVGLSIMLSIGKENFLALLAGAHAMDKHFQQTNLETNLPFLLGALGVYYINGFHYNTHAIIPYDESLYFLPDYLQQLEMESNGKSIKVDGTETTYHTAPIIWGGVGTNTQHSFHQLLHQGNTICPTDFLLPLSNDHHLDDHHRHLVANCLAQSQALMLGKQYPEEEKHRRVAGNKPSTLIAYEKMSPKTLGALIALYEHKTYVQSLFWKINAFDQWGVELGKQLAKPISEALSNSASESSSAGTQMDPSTAFWVRRFQEINSLKR